MGHRGDVCMEIYGRVRRAVLVEGKKSTYSAAQEFGIARGTVRHILRYSDDPGLPADTNGKAAQVGDMDRRDRSHSGRRQKQPNEANTAYGEADAGPVAGGSPTRAAIRS